MVSQKTKSLRQDFSNSSASRPKFENATQIAMKQNKKIMVNFGTGFSTRFGKTEIKLNIVIVSQKTILFLNIRTITLISV